MSKRRVAIVGVAESDFGETPHLSLTAMHGQAASRALGDSGLDKSQIDGLFTTGGTSGLFPLEVAEYLGLKPTYVDSTSVGGSSWETFIEHAVAAIATGKCRTALLVYGSTPRSDMKNKLRGGELSLAPRGIAQYETPFGPTVASRYGMIARRHMYEYGTTSEQLAAVAVAMRRNAGRNPKAFMSEPITVDDVLSSRMIADPLHMLDCCLRTDGGGAVIIGGTEVARDCRKKPAWVIGTGGAVSHVSMTHMDSLTVSPSRISTEIAFGEAGIVPKDVDVLQCYDSFTITVILTLEAMGFCRPGEGGAFVADGKLAWDGKLPTNTDGGGLSSNHPGMRGIFLLIEAVRQLRGESRRRWPMRGSLRAPVRAASCRIAVLSFWPEIELDADWFHPVQDVESEHFWRGCREGRLMIKLCDACGRNHFYPRERCPFCWSDATRWIEASGRGRLYSFSIIHQNPMPPFKARCPYAVVLVALEEGPRIMSNWDFEVPLDQLGCDISVMAAFRSVDDGLVLPVFRPDR